ncbi:hypothetical protein Pelo_5818 [Pelomyxa schiedti]|nr:hypothetical protein Pelo_5818 [Pelomyxa schiedti]
MVHTCGEWVCQLCIDKEQQECPLCSEQLREGAVPAVNKTLLTKLDAMEVYCPSCRGTQKRSQLFSHMEQCPIDCPHKCSARVKPIEMNEHEIVCPMKPVPCLRCGAMIPRSRMAVDHTPSCPIECQLGCGALVAPIKQKEHEEVCVMAVVPCPGAGLSCKWTGTRKEQPDHSRSCAFAQMQPLIFSVINDCKSQVTALTQRVKSLEEQVHELQDSLAKATTQCASSKTPTTTTGNTPVPIPRMVPAAKPLGWNLSLRGVNAGITQDTVKRVAGFGGCVVTPKAAIPNPCTHRFEVQILETDPQWSGSISMMVENMAVAIPSPKNAAATTVCTLWCIGNNPTREHAKLVRTPHIPTRSPQNGAISNPPTPNPALNTPPSGPTPSSLTKYLSTPAPEPAPGPSPGPAAPSWSRQRCAAHTHAPTDASSTTDPPTPHAPTPVRPYSPHHPRAPPRPTILLVRLRLLLPATLS